MKKILYAALITSQLFISCKKDVIAEENISETSVDTTSVDNTATATDTPLVEEVQPNAMGTNPNSIMNQGSSSTQPQTNTVQMPQPVKVAAGMNPSHGQPGHRCDIAVGAPLNSPVGKASGTQLPSQQNSSTNGSSIITTTQSPTTTPIVTAEGMNPPHGQDGHRCDVAVGAPLPKS